MMQNEPTYPLYDVTLKWQQDGVHDPRYPRQHEGLPEGRTHDLIVRHLMFREDKDAAEIEREHREEWWPGFVAERLADKNPTGLTIEVVSQGRETWCLSWFEHWTFDVGQGDAEALASFDRYVSRYQHLQDYPPGEMPEGYRCLMGAEDRWRWRGADDGPAPCRCEHCKQQGVIRIGH